MTPWDKIKPWAGPMLLVLGLMGFAWDSFTDKALAHLWATLGIALFGAWLCDSPGTSRFVQLVLQIVPWVPRAKETCPAPTPGATADTAATEDDHAQSPEVPSREDQGHDPEGATR